MSFDWEGEAQRDGQAPKIPVGEHTLMVSRILYGRQDGTYFVSQKGDPQMMLVYVDLQNRECADMFTLNEAAGWKLARLLGAMGVDMAELKRRAIKPADFAQAEIAEMWLLVPDGPGTGRYGNTFRARVEWTRRGEREYADVTPIRQKPVEPESNADDIPM